MAEEKQPTIIVVKAVADYDRPEGQKTMLETNNQYSHLRVFADNIAPAVTRKLEERFGDLIDSDIVVDVEQNAIVVKFPVSEKPDPLLVETILSPILRHKVEAQVIDAHKCVSCDEIIDENNDYPTDKGIVCYPCYEHDMSEPAATVYYHNHPDHEEDYPYTVGYYHNDTEGDFEVEWHRTDPWRGYYDVKADEDEWAEAHSDCILSMSKDAENLKEFDDALREVLDHLDIPYARIFTRTSNVFSMGYDFFVKADRHEEVMDVVEKLEEAYRDPYKFRTTALTGKDPEDMTEKDHLFTFMAMAMGFGREEES